MRSISIGGLRVDDVTMDTAVHRCIELIDAGGGAVFTPNAEMANFALDDAEFMAVLNGGDLIVPDGAGVVLAAKLLGTPISGKVAGCDLAQNLLPWFEKKGYGLFLFGAKPDIAKSAAAKILSLYPKLVISGIADGYYDNEQDRVNLMKSSGAMVCFVCLGSPKQELFIARHKNDLGILMMGLGGTLDILAGTAKRAPDFYVNHNLEWLYRIAGNPTRWKRSLNLPAFIIKVLKLRGRK